MLHYVRINLARNGLSKKTGTARCTRNSVYVNGYGMKLSRNMLLHALSVFHRAKSIVMSILFHVSILIVRNGLPKKTSIVSCMRSRVSVPQGGMKHNKTMLPFHALSVFLGTKSIAVNMLPDVLIIIAIKVSPTAFVSCMRNSAHFYLLGIMKSQITFQLNAPAASDKKISIVVLTGSLVNMKSVAIKGRMVIVNCMKLSVSTGSNGIIKKKIIAKNSV
jgi:hypothetical protein